MNFRLSGWIFLLYFVIEIALIIGIAQLIGWWTLLLFFLTSFIGLSMLRAIGFQAMTQLRQASQTSHWEGSPSDPPLLTTLAAFLLLIPGFLTDIFGLILLLPFVQTAIKTHFRRKMEQAMKQQNCSPFSDSNSQTIEAGQETIDGTFERKE